MELENQWRIEKQASKSLHRRFVQMFESAVVQLTTLIFVMNIWLIQIGTPVEAAQELLFALLMPLLIVLVALELLIDFKPEWIAAMDERGWLRGANRHD